MAMGPLFLQVTYVYGLLVENNARTHAEVADNKAAGTRRRGADTGGFHLSRVCVMVKADTVL